MLPYKIISADVYIHKIKITFLLVDTLEIFSGKKSDIHNHSNFEKELKILPVTQYISPQKRYRTENLTHQIHYFVALSFILMLLLTTYITETCIISF